MHIPKQHAVREILCSRIKLPTSSAFFQWNEFGPSAGLTASLGSVGVSPDRERLLQPRRYQNYPHWSWLGNWLWALIVKILGYCYLKVQGVFTETLVFRYLMFNRTDKRTKIQPVIESIIQHATYGQQCCISAVPSLTPRHSKLQVFQQTGGAQNFSKPFKKHHTVYAIGCWD